MTDIILPDTLIRLFVTEIYRADLSQRPGFEATLDELDDTCRAIADEDEAGQTWSRQQGYLGYTSYSSIDNLPAYATIFEELRKAIDSHVATFATQLEFDLRGRKLKLDAMWINILEPMATHSGHIHPHSVISGTFYVAVPEGSGALRFEDPRLGMMMNAPLRNRSARMDRRNFAAIEPARGTLLLWESWLRHEVPINLAEDVRISISFNYS